MRNNALLALGFLAQHEDVVAVFEEALDSRLASTQAAAALGTAFTRDERWLVPLREARERAASGMAKAAIDGSIEVIEGGALSLLREDVAAAGQDELPRERIFGTDPNDRRNRRRGR